MGHVLIVSHWKDIFVLELLLLEIFEEKFRPVVREHIHLLRPLFLLLFKVCRRVVCILFFELIVLVMLKQHIDYRLNLTFRLLLEFGLLRSLFLLSAVHLIPFRIFIEVFSRFNRRMSCVIINLGLWWFLMRHFHVHLREYFWEIVSKSVDEEMISNNRDVVSRVINWHFLDLVFYIVTIFFWDLAFFSLEPFHSEIEVKQLEDVVFANELFITHVENIKAKSKKPGNFNALILVNLKGFFFNQNRPKHLEVDHKVECVPIFQVVVNPSHYFICYNFFVPLHDMRLDWSLAQSTCLQVHSVCMLLRLMLRIFLAIWRFIPFFDIFVLFNRVLVNTKALRNFYELIFWADIRLKLVPSKFSDLGPLLHQSLLNGIEAWTRCGVHLILVFFCMQNFITICNGHCGFERRHCFRLLFMRIRKTIRTVMVTVNILNFSILNSWKMKSSFFLMVRAIRLLFYLLLYFLLLSDFVFLPIFNILQELLRIIGHNQSWIFLFH